MGVDLQDPAQARRARRRYQRRDNVAPEARRPARPLSAQARLLSCGSDGAGEAEGAKQRAQLRGDAVDRAGEDADDGIQQATNEGKTHENTSLSEDRRIGGTSWRPHASPYSSMARLASSF